MRTSSSCGRAERDRRVRQTRWPGDRACGSGPRAAPRADRLSAAPSTTSRRASRRAARRASASSAALRRGAMSSESNSKKMTRQPCPLCEGPPLCPRPPSASRSTRDCAPGRRCGPVRGAYRSSRDLDYRMFRPVPRAPRGRGSPRLGAPGTRSTRIPSRRTGRSRPQRYIRPRRPTNRAPPRISRNGRESCKPRKKGAGALPVRFNTHMTPSLTLVSKASSDGSAAHLTSLTTRSEKRPVRGSSRLRSTASTSRPRTALGDAVGHHQPSRREGRRASGMETRARVARRSRLARSAHDLPRAPSRRGLGVICLVVGVEDDRCHQAPSGAKAADIVPTTTQRPARAIAQSSGSSATGYPDLVSRRAASSACACVGARTSTPAGSASSLRSDQSRSAAARSMPSRSPEGPMRTTARPAVQCPSATRHRRSRALYGRRRVREAGRPRRADSGSFATTFSLDAVRSPNASAPAHLHDAHRARSTTDPGGPIPRTAAIGRMATPAGADSELHHPAADAPSLHVDAHLCADSTRSARASGTE